jgi:hypothetical protein
MLVKAGLVKNIRKLTFLAMEMILNCNAASTFPGGYHENKKTSNF